MTANDLGTATETDDHYDVLLRAKEALASASTIIHFPQASNLH